MVVARNEYILKTGVIETQIQFNLVETVKNQDWIKVI